MRKYLLQARLGRSKNQLLQGLEPHELLIRGIFRWQQERDSLKAIAQESPPYDIPQFIGFSLKKNHIIPDLLIALSPPLEIVQHSPGSSSPHNPKLKMKEIFQKVVLFVALTTFLVACASTSSQTLSSRSDFARVFEASKQAAISSGYGVTSSTATDGFISAQKAVIEGNGTAIILNIQVTHRGSGCGVQVSVVPPPGTVGNTQADLEKFTTILRSSIPDIAVSTQ